VLALKERNRHDLATPLGGAVAASVEYLRLHGHIDPPELSDLVLVPAPTRARAARARGGDSVERFALAATSALAPECATVSSVLRMRRGVRDSVGLSAADRAANVAGRIAVSASARSLAGNGSPLGARRRERTILLIDDVLTTGATVSESVCALMDSDVRVDAVLVVAAV
jgi:predicted amidophosphoribosyltransferase